ncbi:MAG: HAD-IA family hydrolase [Anaerolineae bacterium]|nr:HAD-IA family hydrolase [Anaerolineae bacterium]
MIKAVFFDLDDTLLGNPTDSFIRGYLGSLTRYFTARCNIDPAPTIRKSIPVVSGARTGDQNNLDLMLAMLEPTFDRPAAEIRALFEDFYAEEYPALHTLTHPGARSAEIIDRTRGAGYKVVIATNPLYPESAIRQRLAWAGLTPDFAAYDFVTTAEAMHFAKPNPAYYAEILARVGLEPDEVVMVGDHPINDQHAASAIGLHTVSMDVHQHDSYFEVLPRFAMWQPNPLQPAAIAPQWLGNLGALFGQIADMPAHFWNQHPFENEWSPLQIVCHLYEHEGLVHRPRLQTIHAQDNPFIAEPPAPANATDFPPCFDDGAQAARAFFAARQDTLRFIESLAPDAWARPARHSIFGPTTLLEMAYFTAQHDRLHLRQLCQTIGGCE